MPFQLFPIQLIGPFYEDESLQYSSQRTIGLFPSLPVEGRTIRALHWWPGTKAFSTGQVSGVDRGMDVMDGVLFKITDQTLYSVAANGVHTSLGTIDGSNRANLENDGTNLIISIGSKRYQYNTTDGLTTITDADHEPGNTSAFLNRQIIMDGSGGRFQVADVGDPDDINALNFATAESAPDNTIAVAVFDELLHLFGTGPIGGTVETWENTGIGNPPFSKVRGATKEFGLGAVHSIVKTDQNLYCLSSNRSIYRIVQIDFQDITPIPMSDFLKNSRIDDAFGEMIKFGRQWFYVLSFPEADVTWVIPTLDPNSAFQLETGVRGSRYLISSFAEAYGKKLVADWQNSNIYEFDFDTYINFGQTEGMLRERITSPINASSLDLPGREVTMNFVEFLVETGVGNPDDLDPSVLLSASFDNGRSYTNETSVKLGQAGAKETVRLDLLRTFKDVQFKIRYTEKTKFSIHGGGISAKLSGKL
tara:strand:- start:479 stop:1909 length:1431 start_codon:yes stop_codon:yes gene_type:complete